MQSKIHWYVSTPDECWQNQEIKGEKPVADRLKISNNKRQILDGFGGCFNELGWIALGKTSETNRQAVLESLFSKENGLGLGLCRVPIGASDYAAEWYSHNEVDGDLDMIHFSIDRDYLYLLPYIKAAQKIQPELTFFASPWSPPTWMKQPKAYNYGRLRMEPDILDSYALYFEKFIQAYASESVPIQQIHIQNEPFADQKFPSCLWSAEQFRIFIRDYLGPRLAQSGLDTQIWLGTLNGPTQMQFSSTGQITIDLYDKYVDAILFDDKARSFIKGLGFQWAGQHSVQRTHESFPELKIVQTENECGDGGNTWLYAQYVFNLIRHYLDNGANAYIYWNMVLEAEGLSTWGWKQNTLVTIDPETDNVTWNPEYYVLRHVVSYVQPGACLLETSGRWTGSSMAFANPDGSLVIVVSNALDWERTLTLEYEGHELTCVLAANSFNTWLIMP